MFTVEERERVRARLLELARADDGITAAAVTGSEATGESDRWSDVDLAFAVRGDLARAIERWTDRLHGDLGALHHWDLPFGATVYRVFLLPSGLEVDLAFCPEAEFGARGPAWRTVFGAGGGVVPPPPPERDGLVGLAWHHVLHARACIERGRPWQAVHWLAGAREQVLALACLRLGQPVRHARGADRLPAEATHALRATLVASLDEAELRRAVAAAAAALLVELERWDAELAARLRPVLAEVGAASAAA